MPSGAILKITPSPFADAKALYQAILKELKLIHMDSKTEMVNIYKDLFCSGFASEEIEKKLWVCFKRCTYNGGAGDLKIDESTFEPVERREDYMSACIEVAKENVFPFAKSLYAEYQRALSTIETAQA